MTDSVAPKVSLVEKIKANKKVVGGVLGGLVVLGLLVWWFKFRKSGCNSNEESSEEEPAKMKAPSSNSNSKNSNSNKVNSNKVNSNKNQNPYTTDSNGELVPNKPK